MEIIISTTVLHILMALLPADATPVPQNTLLGSVTSLAVDALRTPQRLLHLAAEEARSLSEIPTILRTNRNGTVSSGGLISSGVRAVKDTVSLPSEGIHTLNELTDLLRNLNEGMKTLPEVSELMGELKGELDILIVVIAGCAFGMFVILVAGIVTLCWTNRDKSPRVPRIET